MSILFDNGEKNLVEMTEDLLKACDNCVDIAFKASGMSLMSTMSDLDAETGAMFGGAMELYRHGKNLSLQQAKIIDELNEEVKELRKYVREMSDVVRKMDMKLDNTKQ